MATLNITVPDAVVPRIRDAFGHNDLVTGVRIPATVSEVTDALKAYVKGVVLEYETAKQANTTRNNISQEDWTLP